MIALTRFDDVTRLRCWTWRSRAVGYDVSAYLVRGVLIDTGFRNVWSDMRRALADLRPRGAIVTHWHEDHAGNAPTLAASGLPLWMADYTANRLRERHQVKLYRHFTWGRPVALTGSYAGFDPAPLQVVPTPGHSADHHVVFDPDSATLFSADLWLGARLRVLGASENPYEIVNSLARAIALKPKRMFDAHRGLVDNPIAALEAKRSWLQATIAAVEKRLDASESESAILREVLGGEERTALVSEGEYSRRNFVRAVAAHRATASSAGTR